jgi:exosortase
LAFSGDEYTHVLIILPLSVGLIISERTRIFAQCQTAFAPAFASGILGLLIYVIASKVGVEYGLSLSMCGIAMAWQSAFLLCFGSSAFRLALFPLLFAFFVVPLPPPILAKLVCVLQNSSAWIAVHLLQIAGVPVVSEGRILFLPGLDIEVATQCSGIRSSLVLLATGLVLTHMSLRQLWKKIIVALLITPIAVVKNGLRIFVLCFFAVSVDRAILSSWVHHMGGFVFFGMAFMVLLFCIRMLERVGSTRTASIGQKCPSVPKDKGAEKFWRSDQHIRHHA